MALTPSQAAAVKYDKNLILFAGPGSGKTSTSVEKAVRILTNSANSLCMVTFTSAAAEEMRERAKNRFLQMNVPQPGSRLICGTFHSLALQHYKRHVSAAKRLIAPPARGGMVHAMVAHKEPAERKDYLLALERYQGALDQNSVSFAKEEHYAFVMEYYKRLASTNSTDLAILMRECAMLMDSGDIPLFPVTHLLGDEIQDADEIQLCMIMAHTKRGVTTTLVGDDDQCIYEWRSALGYSGMQYFAKETGAKTIALAENFRSREEIVSHANRLIAFNDPRRIEKNQRATRGSGGRLGYLGFASVRMQCAAVARYIELYVSPTETVAVLARTNSSLDELGVFLDGAEIPFEKASESLWSLPSVAVLISTLTALTNCCTSSLHPLFSVLTLSDKTRRDFVRQLGSSLHSFFQGHVPPLATATADEIEMLTKAARSFATLREQISQGEVNIVIPQVCDLVYDWYCAHLEVSKSSAARVKSDLRKIKWAFESAERILLKLRGKLSERLDTLLRLKDKEENPANVFLMTMHGSKGLEFDTVFLLDACEPDDGSLVVWEEAERRLFFVAMTRARERFYAFYSDSPSPFIKEADLELLQATDWVPPS